MKFLRLAPTAVAALSLWGGAHLIARDALQGPTELLYWNSAKAENGYTLFGVGGTTYLIDMEGRVVHTWPIGTNPHLLDNGGILDAATDDPSGFGSFKEVDWSGSTVWQYTDRRSTYHPHHDFVRIFNTKLGAATTLYIANKDLTAAECIAAGANPAVVPSTGAQMDAIVEVDASGTVIWEWCFFDHIVQDFDASKPNHVGAGKTIADYPGRLNINLTGHPLKSDWLHCNSIDYNPQLDQIVINSVQGEFYVIDHGGTFVAGNPATSIANAAGAAGDFLYRFGDPARYAQGTTPAILEDWTQSTSGQKQLGGAHGVQWIAAGLPGAGHFLIFNNGQYLSEHAPQSYVMEINPYLNASGTDTGHYVNPPDAGYVTQTYPAVTDKTPRSISRQVVWSYSSKNSTTLFSHIGCSAQRLAGGNTLICADTEGYILEVTPAGEVVWDYINPVTKAGAVQVIGDNLPMVNSMFRAYRYPASHPALAGRTLTPGNTIAGRSAVDNPYAGSTSYQAMQRPTGLQYLDSASAYTGYTLFAAGGTTWLIDMQGRVVRTWATGTSPRLLETGRLLDAATSTSGASGFRELDWNGNVVWEYFETRTGYHPHGDFVRIFDPKLNAAATLYLAARDLTHAQCIAAGCDPVDGPYDGAQTDVIVEIDMAGNVVWEWSFFDHGIQNVDATKANHVGSAKTIADFPGRLNLNLPGRPLRSGWPDCNALDYNQSLDQIVINAEPGEFYVIDHGGTFVAGDSVTSIARAASSSGDFLYRFGDPARYGQGSAPSVRVNWEDATSGNKQIGASNHVQWIRPGLPGAGDFLVFNNNQYLFQRTTQSYVFEINPRLDASGTDTGGYINPPAAGYTTWTFDKDTHKASQQLSRQVIWKYGTVGNLALFSPSGSSAQRLPNGNTLICATATGYVLEVTSDGAVAWEFINPVTSIGVVQAIGDCLPETNAVPRALRYAADFAGFTGQDMTPGRLMTDYGTDPTVGWTMLALPDTGQTASYSTTFGEDADYAVNTPAYGDNGDGTITDRVTGLVWQKTDGGEMTWDQAATYAAGLTLGGQGDWRLPFSHELFSILDHGRINPALATAYFTTTTAEYWWAAEQRVDDATKAWAVNAGGGIGAHPKSETISAGGTKRFHVRCVRAPASPAIATLSSDFSDNGDGTVTDKHTGLTWQQAEVPSTMTWEQALAYAENLSLAGHGDWRLPNIKELRSLNDEQRHAPSLDTAAFPGAAAAPYWSSTTLVQDATKAWYMDGDYGLVSYETKTAARRVRCVRGGVASAGAVPELNRIPTGEFQMGDHFNFSDPAHPSDEVPLHTVRIDGFYLGKYTITNREYCAYLNAAHAQALVEVRDGVVYVAGSSTLLCETRSSTLFSEPYSGITWDGSSFTVLAGREDHPMVGVRWEGAAAYCNWLSGTQGFEPVYDLATGAATFTRSGYRLPTEAEWEYAANGGRYYAMFPWGDDTNSSGTYANWQNSGDPYESGALPWTTPVGFYNGQLHTKAEFAWPGSQTTYQTASAANGYGLYDMAGNVWQWTNDWYGKDYYAASPAENPTGPATGDPMPDGKPYRVLRGGNWYNGAEYYGHSRIANRDPAYYRGPQDPNHPYYHVGFRVALRTTSLVRPGATVTPLVTGLQFGEGATADAQGNVVFSDVKANTINKWSLAGQLSVLRSSSGGANGLFCDSSGSLVACESTNGRLVSIDGQGRVTALVAQYDGKRFNEPNDLWIDPEGGIYFTDPVFWGSQVQDGQHVYYLSPNRTTVTRVISDMGRPNGLIGTADGTTLYVSDHGAGKTWRYAIHADGSLGDKTLFASIGSDGMGLDEAGNVYLTADHVRIYSAAGVEIETITMLERPTNLCFGGTDGRTLFITTEHGLYSIGLLVHGAGTVAVPPNVAPVITGTTHTPAIPYASAPVWVTSTVTDDSAVAGVTLTYSTGSGTGTSGTVFQETMTATASKPWTGSGAVYPWTITGTAIEQRTGSNHGTGNACGMEFKGGTANLTDSMAAPTNAINAAGTAGAVEFYIQTNSLDGTDGWTFQLDAGSGYVTRLSELTGSSHAWQIFHYDLAEAECVAGLKMRFQFRGGSGTERIDLDDITVTTTSGSVAVSVAMADDGAHGDGVAGDRVYGGQIPAMVAGSTISYHVSATDDAGLVTADPAGAPTDRYSYVVVAGGGVSTGRLLINEFMADSSTFTPTAEFPARTVGLSVNTSDAFPGYTLVDPMHNKTTYLINNAGQVMHAWTSAYEPGRSAYLMPNGHLVRACMAPGGLSTGGGEGGRIEERDWDGNLVWYVDWATSTTMMHHDFKVLPNGNILMVVAEKRTQAEVLAAGFNPSLLDTQVATSGYMLPDTLVEIQPTGTSGGTVVWEWRIWDHLVQDFDATKANHGVVASHPELIDANGPGIKIPQFWNHINGVDYNAELDQVMLSARNHCEVWVIDHSTTTAQAASHAGGASGHGGDLIYRWGNPQQYDAGTASAQRLFHQHDTQWIAPGCPGAGNILVYNNGLTRPAGTYSTIDEIVPPVDALGRYSITTGSAYAPTASTWTYVATPPASFYSAEISGASRLPNGNTLICEGNTGRIFEVNPAGGIVWQYQCPVGLDGPLVQGMERPVDPRGGYMTAVFKAQRYGLDYPAFAGRTLTPGRTIELYPDWIEIRNPGTAAVDMSGMYLTNDPANPMKWQIPAGVIIPAGGYLLFWADGRSSAGSYHAGFTLDPSGGTLVLYDTDGATRIDVVAYGSRQTDVAYGRDASGSWTNLGGGTPGAVNATPATAPAISQQPSSLTVPAGTAAIFRVSATGTAPLSYQWTRDGVNIAGATEPVCAVFDASAADAGSYRVSISNTAGSVVSSAATLAIGAASGSSEIVNLSVRTHSGTGSETLILGFVVEGSGTQALLVRGVGPELARFGVGGFMVDPRLDVYERVGPTGSLWRTGIDDWGSAANAGDVASTAARLGAFSLASGGRDAALLTDLAGGVFTVHVSATNGGTGIALAELYAGGSSGLARLVNSSARAQVGTGDQILIAGFVIGGADPVALLIRGVGPSLESLGVSGVLADPRLDLYESTTVQGAAVNVLRAGNEDWGGGAALTAAFIRTGAFVLPAGSKDAALLITLQPGVYTAHVSGLGNSTGVALVEVYAVP